MKSFLFWTPRILSLLFIGFLSLFALDVFGEYRGWELATALFMHLRLALILLVATAVAWRYGLVGAITFFGFAIWYVQEVGFDRHWSWYALIAGPAVVVGLLYLADWFMRARDRTS